MSDLDHPLSLYFHIPFCTHRCAYCDFNTYAGQEDAIPAYVNALADEINFVGDSLQNAELEEKRVYTIFFGGGTPSLLSPEQFAVIFKAIRNNFQLTDDAEVTIEANPGTITLPALHKLHDIGINRISFGVQSANTEELHMLERIHTFLDVIEAVTNARKAGFQNINLDLIYGLPEQTLQTWQKTLQKVISLNPEHISAYALTLEHGTPFGKWSSRGLLPIPDPDLAAEMYEYAGEFLAGNNFTQYEISNWSRNSGELTCRHNLQYWRGLPYLAFGAGGHGYANGMRYSNVLRVKTYIDRLIGSKHQNSDLPFPLSPATVNQHKQSRQDDMSEFMMTNLRLVKTGVAESVFRSRFGSGVKDVYQVEVERLLGNGLLEEIRIPGPEVNPEIIYRLTERGRLLGNQVFMQFVG
jgi:oxygen-independent coproporphyrinogen-3 oxidase